MPASTAAGFARARRAHAAETAEDYAEAIADLAAGGSARVGDLAARLGVSHVTVVRTLGRLRAAGIVAGGSRKPLALTRAGRALAARARRRHEIVLRFLLALGVPPAAARADAEGIEHHASTATLAAMRAFTNPARGHTGGPPQPPARPGGR